MNSNTTYLKPICLGIDVSKDHLDIASKQQHWRIDNHEDALKQFCREHHSILEEAFIVIDMSRVRLRIAEATGTYLKITFEH